MGTRTTPEGTGKSVIGRFWCTSRMKSTKAGSAAGKPVVTIEGLARGEQLHPLQQAFIDEQAMQCGYCTSGMIMAGVALLERTPSPSTDDIVHAMNWNVCRCGTYPEIVAAIKRAASARRSS